MPTPDEFYTAANRRLQDENDSRKLADAVAYSIVDDELRPEQAGFIGSLDYFFLAHPIHAVEAGLLV
jgi:predicted TIM-barrel fold metal-dependent hydrolase